jgi:uncharacterized integral membrane protein
MKPLTEIEIRQLKRWQDWMVWTFLLAMLILVLGVAAKALGFLAPHMEWLTGGAFLVLAVLGAIIQFSAKCPRCGARVGLHSRLLLPSHCPRCKVSFRNPSH